MAKERILMVKMLEKTHAELMQLKYDLRLKSASNTVQYLLEFHKKKK